jgi:uncharacterized protein
MTLQWIYTLAGSVCVGLAFLGVFLPLVPVTPFLLLAAFCFSKGSERMHKWLMGHRTFGPIITDWQRHRVIRPRNKRLAIGLLVVLTVCVLVFGHYAFEFQALSVLISLIVIILIYRCPSQKR